MLKTIVALLLVMFFFCSESSFASNNQDNYVFLGNHNIPPFIFMRNGEPAGLIVDIAYALAQKSGLNIEVKAMDWSEAQSKVLLGEADALLQININKEREKLYDFSEPLLESKFSIFHKDSRIDLINIESLFGLTVGVEAKGYPVELIKKYPEVRSRKIPNWKTGFGLVNFGEIEAVVVDRWVGEYELAINKIQGITVVDEPVEISYSRIAVKKGNHLLLNRINEGLAIMREDGTMYQILNKWSRKEVVYLSKEQLHDYKLSIILAVLSGILFFVIMVTSLRWNRRLRKEIDSRKQVEEILNQFKFTLDQTLDSIFMFKPDSLKFFYVNQGAMDQVGYTKEEFFEMTPLDIKPEFTEETFRNIVKPLVDGEKESLLFKTVHRHKNKTLIPVEIFLQFVKQPTEKNGRFMAIVRDITKQKKAHEELVLAHQRMQTVLDTVDAMIYVADMDTYEILLTNKYIKEKFGDIEGKRCWEAIQAGQSGPCDFCGFHNLLKNNQLITGTHVWQIQNTKNGEWYECHDGCIKWVDGRTVRLQVATNISENKKNEQEREMLIAQLKKAVSEIKTLRGILPICSFCKNIRNDEGYYEKIEGYIHKHSGVDFSHTICPTCMKKHYPEYADKKSQNNMITTDTD